MNGYWTLEGRGRRGGVMKSAIGLLLFVSAGGTLGWMLLLPSVLRFELESRTGFQVEIGTLSSNPLGFSVEAKDFVVRNPEEFGGGAPMLAISRLYASGSFASLGRGAFWADEMEIEIASATLVKDERGRLNLEAFARRAFESPEKGKPLSFYAETVHLVIDEVTFVDYSVAVPQSKSYRVSLDVSLRQLEDSRALFGPVFELAERVGGL